MTERKPSLVLPGATASAEALFACGVLLFPPFLMQRDLVVRAGLILVFGVLGALAGRRVRLVQSAVVAAGIVVFNLVIPMGRVLASVLGLAVTEGALKTGLMKATAMTGLIILSQFSIRPTLRLPGILGGLLARSLFYFEAIMSQKNRMNRRDIIGSIDTLLLAVDAAGRLSFQAAGEESRKTEATSPRRRFLGLSILVLLVAGSWAVLVATLVHPRPFWGQ